MTGEEFQSWANERGLPQTLPQTLIEHALTVDDLPWGYHDAMENS